MALFKYILNWLNDLKNVFRHEWSTVLSDMGVLIFFIFLPLAYPIVYTLIYNPEVVEDMPFAVVDNCRSVESRHLVLNADATPAMKLAGYASDMAQARQWMAQGKVFGIMEIPRDYSQLLMNNEQAVVPFYCDMSLMLRYRNFLSALTDLQMQAIGEQTLRKVQDYGATGLVTSLPVNSEAHFMGDISQGFASFVIPGIVILILQQSMILGISMLAGTAAERRRRNRGIDPLAVKASASATIWGKALCYTIFYIPLTIYILHFIPVMFDLPHIGAPSDYLLFAFPLLLGSAFVGLTIGALCREREDSFLLFVFTSVIFLFLSGLSWPRIAMNTLCKAIGSIIPSTWAVDGFIRINSNAATLADTSFQFSALWALVVFYMITAYILQRWYYRSAR
jgi:ABC-2 type transport system permease protein